MKNSILLPYLAVKFIWDVDLVIHKKLKANLKCIKLLADFTRCLGNTSLLEIEESIEIAQKWQVSSHYYHVLQSISFLVPEIYLEGVPQVDATDLSFNRLLNNLFSEFQP